MWEWCWVLILHGQNAGRYTHRKLLIASSQWQEQCNVLLDQNEFSIQQFFYLFFLKKYAWQALAKSDGNLLSCFEIYLTIILKNVTTICWVSSQKNFVTLNHPHKIFVSFVGIRQFRSRNLGAVPGSLDKWKRFLLDQRWEIGEGLAWLGRHEFGSPVNWHTFGWQPKIRRENQLRLVVYPTIYRFLFLFTYKYTSEVLIAGFLKHQHCVFWGGMEKCFSTAWKGRGVEGTWAWEVCFFLEKEVHCLKLSWFSTFRSILPSVFFMDSLIAVIISNSQWWYTKPNNILTWLCCFLSKPKFLSTPQIFHMKPENDGFSKGSWFSSGWCSGSW